MIDFQKTIQSDLVVLRPMQSSDFFQMHPLTKEPQMWYYFTSDLSNEAALKDWISTALSELDKKISLPFSIIDANNEEYIGTTRISNISDRDSRVEIGWTWIAKKYHGTGINQHVKKLLFQYLFTQTSVVRIEFKTDVLNIAARKGMLKAGLKEEGILRSHTLMTNHRRRDTIYFSLLKDEWKKVKSY